MSSPYAVIEVLALLSRTMNLESIRGLLADIDNHIEPVSARTEPGSDIHVLAHAIHLLAGCVRQVAEEIAWQP